MRHFPKEAALLLGLFLAACSDPLPPAGRWQGAYEDAGVIILARLEIDGGGQVRVSAPNAITDTGVVTDSERAELRARLEAGLDSAWPDVAPLALEFDGRAFHKPGGVAPQLEWDKAGNRMILVYYSGNRAAVRIKLDPVKDFGT